MGISTKQNVLALGSMMLLVPAWAATVAGSSSGNNNNSSSSQIQVIDQKSFNALPKVLPTSESNATTYFHPPGTTETSLKERPFHVYDPEFYDIIGSNPTLTQIANQPEGYEIFHEAVVWSPHTEEVFFVQNSGALSTVPVYNTSSGIYKVSLPEIEQALLLATQEGGNRNVTGQVKVQKVEPEEGSPKIVNPNGGTNYKGDILFLTKGRGEAITPELVLMSTEEPYNTTVLMNNYFGRQFTSLNDVAVHPVNGDLYFTDTLSAWLQGFRPAPGLQPQAYRYNVGTGAVTVVADGFTVPNGLVFSPKGDKVYIVDSGAHYGTEWNLQYPSSIYEYDVLPNGKFANRQVFAFADSGTPDGIHCDSNGNVYAGCGDGVQVWNRDGKLLGKIYVGSTVANFNFAGKGRMLITAEAELYYATVGAAAEGSVPVGDM